MEMTQERKYYAHSLENKPVEEWQTLEEHLEMVAQFAYEYATPFSGGEFAEIAGLLHDLGKYADQFQRRLMCPAKEKGRDHWTAGAAAILSCYKHLGEIAALCVEGHHIGLQQIRPYRDWLNYIKKDITDTEVADRFTEKNFKLLHDRFLLDDLNYPSIDMNQTGFSLHDIKKSAPAMLDTRMLYSALVDADFKDTEGFFNSNGNFPRKYRPDGPNLEIQKCIHRLKEYMQVIRENSIANKEINRARDYLMQNCIDAANMQTGLFTLTAPTGAGKTLSMLAFALHHAKLMKLRRIIIVMPFLNIIEQTLSKYIELFGNKDDFPDNFILEDHSLAYIKNMDDLLDDEKEIYQIKKLLSENWDGPIILTTNVKCLESIMSNKPSSCRKLHRLSKSVILFDEVQTLPPRLIVPTLATLSRLADPNGPYNSTVVFSTATQPAFNHLNEQVKKLNPVGWKPVEIVKDFKNLFKVSAKRSSVKWRYDEHIELSDLAKELKTHEQVMCIVNLKRHATELALFLKSNVNQNIFHLSTNMCPNHRKDILQKINICLDNNRPVKLVSTQCVEAGVDIDFPIVYRALAPLDSLAQAAGRCNRHGIQTKKGHVIIFRLKSDGNIEFPPGYKEGVQTTEIFLNHLKVEHPALDEIEIFNNPELLKRYYQQFYALTGRGKGEMHDEKELWQAMEEGDFVKVAQEYQLITADQINVLVPYAYEKFEELVKEATEEGLYDFKSIRKWRAKAKQFSVSIYRPKYNASAWNDMIPIQFGAHSKKKVDDADWYFLSPQGNYDELVGLQFSDTNYYMD